VTPAEQLAVLTAFVARIPYRPDRRTPEEVARDNVLESLAEARAEERSAQISGRDADAAADRYYGGAA
jgi:hypothetical protein